MIINSCLISRHNVFFRHKTIASSFFSQIIVFIWKVFIVYYSKHQFVVLFVVLGIKLSFLSENSASMLCFLNIFFKDLENNKPFWEIRSSHWLRKFFEPAFLLPMHKFHQNEKPYTLILVWNNCNVIKSYMLQLRSVSYYESLNTNAFAP